ncbi:MAG: hypothetical protein FJY97_05050 [candidate division Zixibacteria bacterium]|nr:hypothetical protein [candidate division Zixibacteria bacterium]
MQCPTCGSTDVYRSKRDWFERIFNGLFWYHQRPYRCGYGMTRYWVRLEPRVWRHAFKLRLHKLVLGWGFYIGGLMLAIVVAWVLNFIQHNSQQAVNPFLQNMAKENLKKDWENLSKDQQDQYAKQAESLSPEQKEAIRNMLEGQK